MYKLALESDQNRQYVFNRCANKTDIPIALVEKDFWVCLLLDYLFHKSKMGPHIAFKGGTCLSKVYNAIDRFSEDIDLILDWRVLGYEANEPWLNRSKTQQVKFNDEANEKTAAFLESTLIPSIREDFQKLLGRSIDVALDKNDKQTVNFYYPATSSDESILKPIRLEIGALAAWSPWCYRPIASHVAEVFPQHFAQPSTVVRATSIERSFWEKATILHQEAHRPEGSRVPRRYSRHYYDLYRLATSEYKDSALREVELLKKVAVFKEKFYPRTWARYDLAANPETLKLIPEKHVEIELRRDYVGMQAMLYGKHPTFDEILDTLKKLENEIHALKKSAI